MSEHIIDLGTEITIRNIQPVYESLTKSLQDPRDLTINASQLTKVDTAGAQLLFLFEQTCNKRSLLINWKGATPELANELKELGIDIPAIFATLS